MLFGTPARAEHRVIHAARKLGLPSPLVSGAMVASAIGTFFSIGPRCDRLRL
jgi:hypothetical protein